MNGKRTFCNNYLPTIYHVCSFILTCNNQFSLNFLILLTVCGGIVLYLKSPFIEFWMFKSVSLSYVNLFPFGSVHPPSSMLTCTARLSSVKVGWVIISELKITKQSTKIFPLVLVSSINAAFTKTNITIITTNLSPFLSSLCNQMH